MKIFSYRYLTQDQLRRFDSYKYAAIDTSPISQYIMHPFWNYLVQFVPISIAPNVITVVGFACTVTNAILLSYYDYRFFASSDDMRNSYEPIPSWVWLVCAINLFLAHTLDGIDGKQARRTKSTGPLGELMDHGVDSWTAVFVPLYVYSLFGAADYSFGPKRMFFIFWAVFLTFYLSHWEKYNTGVLYLPWSYDLSQIFLFVCSLATFFGTYQLWKAFLLPGLYVSVAFELLLYVSILFTLPLPIYNVFAACNSGKCKYSSINDIGRPFLPFVQLFVLSTLWVSLSQNDILNQDPRVYFYTTGTVFSNIACRLIVCQMSSTKCELVNGLTVAFSLVALCSVLVPATATLELLLLRLLAIALTMAHLHYAVCVVRQMCDYFNINCFTLKKGDSETSRQHLLANSFDSLYNNQVAAAAQNSLLLANELANGSNLQSIEDEQIMG